MFILCDTSSILMLLRIAPNMFTDQRYGCKTIRQVHDEIIRTTKFKTKYPWTRQMRSKVKPVVLSKDQIQVEAMYFEVVRTLNYQGTVNRKTGRLIDLSREDMRLISHALALECKITSGDRDLVQFARHEFKGELRGNVSPLEIVNHWLESGVIQWGDEKQLYLSAWAEDHEHPQPPEAKKRFMELSGYRYTGT